DVVSACRYNAADDSARDRLAPGAVQSADADLRVYRVQPRPAALSAHQPAAGVAALGTRRLEVDRTVRAHPASIHVEVHLVAARRPLRAADPRPAARLDAGDAIAADCLHPALRSAIAAARPVDDRVPR